MTVMGEVAQIMGLDAEQIGGEGSLEHAVGEDAREEVGEDGDDVELHVGWRCAPVFTYRYSRSFDSATLRSG